MLDIWRNYLYTPDCTFRKGKKKYCWHSFITMWHKSIHICTAQNSCTAFLRFDLFYRDWYKIKVKRFSICCKGRMNGLKLGFKLKRKTPSYDSSHPASDNAGNLCATEMNVGEILWFTVVFLPSIRNLGKSKRSNCHCCDLVRKHRDRVAQ